MSTDTTVRPSTLDGIKRLARSIKRQHGIQYTRALDAAAQKGGFQNFRHARNTLESGRTIAPQTGQPAAVANPPPATLQAVVAQPSPAAQPLPRHPSVASAHAENLRAQIRSNEDTLQAILDGRITGMGYGTNLYFNSARAIAEAPPSMFEANSLHSAASVAMEIERLEQRIAQDRALLRMHEAKESGAGHL